MPAPSSAPLRPATPITFFFVVVVVVGVTTRRATGRRRGSSPSRGGCSPSAVCASTSTFASAATPAPGRPGRLTPRAGDKVIDDAVVVAVGIRLRLPGVPSPSPQHLAGGLQPEHHVGTPALAPRQRHSVEYAGTRRIKGLVGNDAAPTSSAPRLQQIRISRSSEGCTRLRSRGERATELARQGSRIQRCQWPQGQAKSLRHEDRKDAVDDVLWRQNI